MVQGKCVELYSQREAKTRGGLAMEDKKVVLKCACFQRAGFPANAPDFLGHRGKVCRVFMQASARVITDTKLFSHQTSSPSHTT